VCTTGDTAHIDTIFKFLPHTRQHGCIDIRIHTVTSPSGRIVNYDEKQPSGGKKLSYSFNLYRFRKYVSYGFPIINIVIHEYIMQRPNNEYYKYTAYEEDVIGMVASNFSQFYNFLWKRDFSFAPSVFTPHVFRNRSRA
jgi:hypothetical protein